MTTPTTTGTAELPEALPRYREYMHLRTTGAWSDGVPAWAKDYSGLMNDMTAAHAVIEELYAKVEALSAAQAGAPAPQPSPSPAPAVRWNDAAILSLLNRFGDGPYGEEDVLTMRRALVHYEEIRRDLEAASPAPAQPGQEGEREAFIRWYMEYLHTDEMLAAYVWDNEHIVPQTWRAARAQADIGAAPAAGAVAGWQWVPVEPTHKMLAAASIMRWRYDALLAASPTPPAQAADSMLEGAARLAKITQAIRDYHFALDCREHGGVAMARAWNAICDVLNMDWVQGAESAARKQGANHD